MALLPRRITVRLSGERYRIMRTQEWSDEAIERVRRGR
jgi:hypothetical protein